MCFLSGSSTRITFSPFFQINKGGLAIYGGILGGVAVVLIYCKVKKLSF
mgnify:CR=1 FL=1